MADQFLSLPDRQRLPMILAKVADLQMGPGARAAFLKAAGLGRFVTSVNLAAETPQLFTRELVTKLEEYGMLPPVPSQPNFHALGALVNYASQISDPDEARFLAEMMVKYQLIADPDYLAQLSADYQITVAPARQADPAKMPPTAAPAPVAEPAFEPIVDPKIGLEKVIGDEPNFVDIDLLCGALYSAQAVGRIERPSGVALGTGFLVGPNLLLTNYHVLSSKDMLDSAVVRFDYLANADGIAAQGRTFEFQPDFFQSSPDTELDFALVKLKGEPLGDPDRKLRPEDEGLGYLELLRRGRHRGYLLVAPRQIVGREQINIIQHPKGNPQKVVLTQNYVLADMGDTRVHYLADTEPGSSGSPVFNRKWEVVALHHSGGAHPPPKASSELQRLLKGVARFNEGIPMKAILPRIQEYLPKR